ncbi:MAG: DUF4290 domain-containing protein [Bacteroidales bacterium]|nr:DUF4290 domain-containing protein [Bacteroidales bacterium]
MEYNTSRKQLILPEYGRNIQKLVEYCKTIKDKEKRNKMAQAIIDIMGNMYPHFRDIADFKHKLWDHLQMMAEYELDIDSPYEAPPKETFRSEPDPVPYNNKEIKYKHYGKVIERLIQKASEFEEGEEKNALIETIGNQMKKNYLIWNKDTVSDEQIFKDMEELSGGKIKVDREKVKLTDAKDIVSKFKKKRNTKKGKNNNHQKSH